VAELCLAARLDWKSVVANSSTAEIHRLSTILVDAFPKRVCYALHNDKDQNLWEN